MRSTNRVSQIIVAALAIVAHGVTAPALLAQDVVFPGSTVEGDILRGQGQFLKGAAMYELYSARGRAIDAQTAIAVQKWNAEVYDAYMRARATQIEYRRNLTKAQIEKAKRGAAETEERLRTNPTPQDIVRGDALNALLTDLSNPSISDSSWRVAPVPLPDRVSVRSLFFRFAPRIGDKSSNSLQSNLIALGRLDPGKSWPTYLPEETLGKELRAYEAAYRNLLSSCEGGHLTLPVVDALDSALLTLRAKVKAVVPAARHFRATADRYVGDLQAATRIFDATTIDFAQEMIRDTHEYKAQTVAELLAYMRKYRLLFASAGGRPEDAETYRLLYGVLRQQKEKLNLPVVQQPSVSPLTSRAIDVLLIHLKDIATDLPKIQVSSQDKKAIMDKLTAEATTIIEQVSNTQPLSDRNLLALNQLIRDLRFAIENPDTRLRIVNGGTVTQIKGVIGTLETDLRDIEQTQR
jgi:hypothetical protein